MIIPATAARQVALFVQATASAAVAAALLVLGLRWPQPGTPWAQFALATLSVGASIANVIAAGNRAGLLRATLLCASAAFWLCLVVLGAASLSFGIYLLPLAALAAVMAAHSLGTAGSTQNEIIAVFIGAVVSLLYLAIVLTASATATPQHLCLPGETGSMVVEYHGRLLQYHCLEGHAVGSLLDSGQVSSTQANQKESRMYQLAS